MPIQAAIPQCFQVFLNDLIANGYRHDQSITQILRKIHLKMRTNRGLIGLEMSRRPDQHTSPRGRRHPLRPDLDMASIAKRVGCSPSHLSDVLRGRRRLTEAMAIKLAPALGVPEAKLVDTVAAWAAQVAFTERRRR